MELATRLHLSWRGAAIIIALMCLLLAAIVAANSPIPRINRSFGDTTLHFSADRAWALVPGDCVTLRWQVEGIESLHINGRGEIGQGEKAFCPGVNSSHAQFNVLAPDGLPRHYELRIHFLPGLLLYLAGFVGALGGIGLIVWLLLPGRLERALDPRWLVVSLAGLIVAGAALHLPEPRHPRVDVDEGEIVLSMRAGHGLLVFPQECASLRIAVAGAGAVSFNGEPLAMAHNLASAAHCEDDGPIARLQVAAANGEARVYELEIPALFAALTETPVYLYLNLALTGFAALLYLPLAVENARRNWKRREWTELLTPAAFALLPLLVYLPFGFDTAGQWEEWATWAYFDQSVDAWAREYPLRWSIMLPRAIAWQIDSRSFVSLHVLQWASLALTPALFYGVMRKLGVRAFYAFLAAALYFAFPVNDQLLSTRYFPVIAPTLWLTLAAFTSLDYLEKPRWRTLAGALLALTLHVGSYEAGLALVIALPAFLWLRRGQLSSRQVNLALLWLAAAAFKIGYFVLVYTTGRRFYGTGIVNRELRRAASNELQSLPEIVLEALANVYGRAFGLGWRDALDSLAGNEWLPLAVTGLLCVGAFALAQSRLDGHAPQADGRDALRSLVCGLLLILPGIAVTMWISNYREGTTRLFLYTAFGGAIALLSLALLATAWLRGRRARDLALLALCLALLLPGLARLFAMHERLAHSADEKARILLQTARLVPRPHPDSSLLMMTAMTRDELEDLHVEELARGSMFSGAIATLYLDHAPRDSYFCYHPGACSRDVESQFDPSDHARLQKTITLALNRDLTVELVADPASRFGLGMDSDYDVSALHDADAPLPPRAVTMLSSVYESGGQ